MMEIKEMHKPKRPPHTVMKKLEFIKTYQQRILSELLCIPAKKSVQVYNSSRFNAAIIWLLK